MASGTHARKLFSRPARLAAPVPVIGRIFRGEFLLDLRTILEDDLPALAAALRVLAP